jgi:hypothetical protein
MNKKLNFLTKIFKLDFLGRKGLSPRRKRQNGRPNHVPPRITFLGRRGATSHRKKD